jgi:hypothetical protein
MRAFILFLQWKFSVVRQGHTSEGYALFVLSRLEFNGRMGALSVFLAFSKGAALEKGVIKRIIDVIRIEHGFNF